MKADEFLRRYAPSPERIRTQHDDTDNVEIDKLASKFGPSIPPYGVESCTPNEVAAGPILHS